MIIIYHRNCYDGFTAAWIARNRYGEDGNRFVGANYGEEPPTVDGEEVLIVDFSYPRDVLEGMRERASSLQVLDHHKTAEEALRNLPYCTFDMGRSGAGLAWDVLIGGTRPWLVDVVEDRDLWRLALPHTEVAHCLIASTPFTFKDWDELAAMPVTRAIELGKGAWKYKQQYITKAAEHARSMNLLGYQNVPVVNVPYMGISDTLDHILKQYSDVPFAMGWFWRDDGQFQYSLRSLPSSGIDVSAIAKTQGGGGHANAAGFQHEQGPWGL